MSKSFQYLIRVLFAEVNSLMTMWSVVGAAFGTLVIYVMEVFRISASVMGKC